MEDRVANSYLFVLKDLKTPNNKHWINSLTLLALEDIEYYNGIAGVIQQQFWKVRIYFYYFYFF